jgi:hypothetical protein
LIDFKQNLDCIPSIQSYFCFRIGGYCIVSRTRIISIIEIGGIWEKATIEKEMHGAVPQEKAETKRKRKKDTCGTRDIFVAL